MDFGLRPGRESAGRATEPYRLRASPRLYTNLVGTLARKIRGVFRFRYRHKSPRVVQVQC